jgi:tripeptide aminopeptidase
MGLQKNRDFQDYRLILKSTRLVDYFLELVRYDTQSDDNSETWPSTAKQLPALQAVKKHLLALGLADADIDQFGYLYASLRGNTSGDVAIGLIAHIDTALDFSGANVNPIVHENYQGAPLRLKSDVVIDPATSPELLQCIGDDVISADGATLLGADDKAGVAEILAAVEFLLKHPELPRPTVKIAVTPDEEIGRGAEKFDLQRFAARCAYTLDGGFIGEINGETFHADSAVVTINGVAVHPGKAKDKMVNALRFAADFLKMLPAEEAPETTANREGFFHPTAISGNAAQATIKMILRDFDLAGLKRRGEQVKKIKEKLLALEPRLKIDVVIEETYRNMADKLSENPEVMDYLLQATKASGIQPVVSPIRGGTDGSGLTAQGLPTPNIFTGGVNAHGPQEWVSTRAMALSVCAVINLLRLWSGERS